MLYTTQDKRHNACKSGLYTLCSGRLANSTERYANSCELSLVLPVCRLALAEDVKQASLPLDVCTAALQGVQAVLPHATPQRRAALLAAVTSLSVRSSVRSSIRAACLEFQQSLLAKGGAVLYPQPLTGVPLLPEDVVVEWVQVSRDACL